MAGQGSISRSDTIFDPGMTEAVPETSLADDDTTAAAPDATVPPALLAAIGACIAILVTNLYFAQPLIALIARDLHVPPSLAGTIVSASQFGYGLGLFLLVPLSDVVENRRLVLICGGIALLATIGLATARSAPVFLACALVTGMFSSGAQVLLPYLSHLLPAHSRGRQLGTIMGGVLTAVMLARPSALFVSSLFGWRAIYWISAGLTLLFGTILAAIMPPRRPEHRTPYHRTIGSMFPLFAAERQVRRRTAYQAILFAVFTMFWAVAPIMLAQRFGLSQSRIGLFALAGAGGALVSPIAGRWADRGSIRLGTVGASLVLAAALLATLWAVDTLAPVPLVVAAVLIDAAIQTSQAFSRLVVLGVTPERRGRVNALYMTITYTSGAIGSIVGVSVYVAFGWAAVALLGTGMALAVTLLVLAEPASIRVAPRALNAA